MTNPTDAQGVQDMDLKQLLESTWGDESSRANQVRMLCKQLEQLRAENAKLRAQSEWRPIETAPKDGTKFLSCNQRQGNLMAVTWFSRTRGYFIATGGQHLYQFTCWKPLGPPLQEQDDD